MTGVTPDTNKNQKLPGKNRNATIRDVSKLAGVSRMTVSRVLTNPEIVSPKTRLKVEQAIENLGYVPDLAAGSLSTKKTGFIGLLLPTLTNANFSMAAHGLTDALKPHGFQIIIGYTDYDIDEEERQVRNLLARRPEAIVLTGGKHTNGTNRLLMAANIPVIEIADMPSNPIQHSIGFSNEFIGRVAARHLLSKGFTRIGALGSQLTSHAGDYRGESRLKGFEEELKLAGVSTQYVLRHGEAPVSFSHGRKAISELLDREGQDVEAVFAVSDLSAVGALMECQRRGIKVPDDISLLGFGNFEIGKEVVPSLSTIDVDFRGLGNQTGELIRQLLNSTVTAQTEKRDIGLDIIQRESVR